MSVVVSYEGTELFEAESSTAHPAWSFWHRVKFIPGSDLQVIADRLNATGNYHWELGGTHVSLPPIFSVKRSDSLEGVA